MIQRFLHKVLLGLARTMAFAAGLCESDQTELERIMFNGNGELERLPGDLHQDPMLRTKGQG